MDILTWSGVVIFNVVFLMLALHFKASIFSTTAGIEIVSALAYMMAGGGVLVIRTFINPLTGLLVTQNASTTDYVIFFTILIVLAAISFFTTMMLRNRSKDEW